MNKRFLALLCALLMVIGLVGCGEDTTTPTDDNTNKDSATTEDTATNDIGSVYGNEDFGFQMNDPAEGDQVVIMHTSMGDIAIRLFPEAAPKAVENFVTHAQNGYYDGLTFHRVIEDFMIQGGDPSGNGTGGESIWNKDFEDEFDQKLMNVRGSLAMANSGVNTNGSQFFINQGGPTGDTAEELAAKYDYDMMVARCKNTYDQYVAYYGDYFKAQYPSLDSFVEANLTPDARLVPDEVWELYAEVGGNIHLDGAWRHEGGHTVFGQVYEGMDVVDAIAAVEVNAETDAPLNAVTIDSMEVIAYGDLHND